MLKIKKNEVFLKDHTSFKVGGPCNFFADTRSLEDIKNALFFSKEMKIPFIVMGEGTNILVSDSGFDGLIIKISLDDYYFYEDLLVSEAGTHLGDLVNSTINKELSGLEWAGGLPGSLGGAVRGNAGARSEGVV